MNDLVYKVSKKLSKLLPSGLVYRGAHFLAKRDFEGFVRDRLGPYFVPVEEGPPGSQEIMLTTAAMNEHELWTGMEVHRYFARSYATVRGWLRALDTHGFNLRTCGSVLEIGCGSARLIRHFRCMDGARVVGTDADPKAIEWCRRNIPGMEFHVNKLSPPLPFDANSFDLAFAASVFTHIPLTVQQAWIEEMCRVIRPSGFFICTIEGWFNQRRQLSPENRAQLRADRQLMLLPNDINSSLSTKALDSWDVFQLRDQVIGAFGSAFEILDYRPGVQDVLILRKSRDMRVTQPSRGDSYFEAAALAEGLNSRTR
jgi:SAM-dependent methyltransferase